MPGAAPSSYREVEETDLIVLWGSNARETHPIFFHHVLKGVRNGARLYAVDPRRTSSAEWADSWLGLDVGSDIALANAVAREIIAAGLEDREFIERATTGFDAYKAKVEPYTLDYAERETGVPAEAIRDLAHAFATAPRAMICWTLGITEHHNAVDNVLALISLVLLTGHVGRYGSGVNPLRGQNNVQGGGDMGALPDRLPGFQHVENDALRARFDAEWGVAVPPRRGWHLSGMFDAMERGELTAVYCIGENPVQSEADQKRAIDLLDGPRLPGRPGPVPDQDRRARRCRPAGDRGLGRVRGDRHQLRAPRPARPQGGRAAGRRPRRPGDHLRARQPDGRRLGRGRRRKRVWNEVRRALPGPRRDVATRASRPRAGSSGRATTRTTRASSSSTRGCGRTRSRATACRSCRSTTTRRSTSSTHDFPIRLTTGRRLDSYNTGVQTAGYTSPLRRGESLDISPEDAATYALADGERVRVVSRRGQVEVPIRIDPSLRPGLTFMTLHFQDEVAVNLLTIDATDPKSGTAEFKATAIRIEKLAVPAAV